MRDDRANQRKELLPGADPDHVRPALTKREQEQDPEPEAFEHDGFDPDDPDTYWLQGDDPEASVVRTADQRAVIKRQLKSEGAQFVYGLLVLAGALGAIALAVTIQTVLFIAIACVSSPIAMYWFRDKWRRWLGSAPYCYKLLSSLGEDAENVREAHEVKERQKYVRAVGDLYEHTRPKDRR